MILYDEGKSLKEKENLSFEDVFTTLVIQIHKDHFTAFVIEARKNEGLFCKAKFSKSLLEQHCEVSQDDEKSKRFPITFGLDGLFKELKFHSQIKIDLIKSIVCVTKKFDEINNREDQSDTNINRNAFLIQCYFQGDQFAEFKELDKSSTSEDDKNSLLEILHSLQIKDCNLQSTIPKVNDRLIKQFGFDKECFILQTLPGRMASFISCMPKANDVTLEMGISDYFFIPITNKKLDEIKSQFKIDKDYQNTINVLPNPFYFFNSSFNETEDEKTFHKPLLCIYKFKGTGKARKIIRDEYTKTWKSFKHLVQVISPGGNSGLDDKLFLFFWFNKHCNQQQQQQQQLDGIVRKYEHGTCVTEFNDLRANPRCTLEGQALLLRRILSQSNNSETNKNDGEYWGAAHSLPFKPFDRSNCPERCYIWGGEPSDGTSQDHTIELECSAEVISQVIGAQCFVQSISDDHIREEGNLDNSIIGAVYLSLFVQHRMKSESNAKKFEEVVEFYQSVTPSSPCLDDYSEFQPISPIIQTKSESLMTTTDDQQFTPRLTQRNQSNLYFNQDSESTPTLQNRIIRSVSSAAELMRERFYEKGENLVENSTSSTENINQSRNRSVSLSVSHQFNLTSSSMGKEDDNFHNNLASSSSPTSELQRLSSPPTSSYSSTELGHSHVGSDDQEEEEVENNDNQIKIQYESIDHSDEDLWLFYGAMLEEHIRLFDSFQKRLY